MNRLSSENLEKREMMSANAMVVDDPIPVQHMHQETAVYGYYCSSDTWSGVSEASSSRYTDWLETCTVKSGTDLDQGIVGGGHSWPRTNSDSSAIADAGINDLLSQIFTDGFESGDVEQRIIDESLITNDAIWPHHTRSADDPKDMPPRLSGTFQLQLDQQGGAGLVINLSIGWEPE